MDYRQRFTDFRYKAIPGGDPDIWREWCLADETGVDVSKFTKTINLPGSNYSGVKTFVLYSEAVKLFTE